eukprot:TRINITY_DN17718_c0_g1_i1.p1 TRINITY_DN17718_c0_g1~~TRINITY_DN17718_c0_g1_i1.p1  ORF type:complete len:167 (+),score=14.63 TRINITY_DN17718_c0_g1_i1:85-585(+)
MCIRDSAALVVLLKTYVKQRGSLMPSAPTDTEKNWLSNWTSAIQDGWKPLGAAVLHVDDIRKLWNRVLKDVVAARQQASRTAKRERDATARELDVFENNAVSAKIEEVIGENIHLRQVIRDLMTKFEAFIEGERQASRELAARNAETTAKNAETIAELVRVIAGKS